MSKEPEESPYGQEYSEQKFWQKAKDFALKAGEDLLLKAFQLYYASLKEETPKWAKTVIYASLGYFIVPLDTAPDLLPGGLVDDFGVLALAITTLNSYIDDEVKEKAQERLSQFIKTPPNSD